MRPAWRLAINSISARRSRSLLLVAVIAMSAMLISAVGVALASVRDAIQNRVEAVIGTANLQIKPAGRGSLFDEKLLDTVRAWPETKEAYPLLSSPLALRFARLSWKKDADQPIWRRQSETHATSSIGVGLDTAGQGKIRDVRLVSGRLPQRDDEIVLDQELARRLSERHMSSIDINAAMAFMQKTAIPPTKANPGPETVSTQAEADRLNKSGGVELGDRVQLVRFQKSPLELTVVGIAEQPPLGGNPQGYLTVRALQEATNQPGKLSQIAIVASAKDEAALEATAERHKKDLPPTVLIQTTSKITSGLNKNLETNQIAFVVISMLSFIAASFIIMTGMSTGVIERMRELGVLRCVGASRGQLAANQLLQGLVLGIAGAIIGIPLGVLGAVCMILYFKDQIHADVNIEAWRLALAFAGATFASTLGAVYPAWQASRVSPLQALASRANPPRRRTTALIIAFGLCGVLIHLAVFTFIQDSNTLFYTYLGAGLPGILGGYFLLGVPTVLIVVTLLGPAVEKVLHIPKNLLTRTIRGTPYRFGFTASAMMLGLGLMISIWTQGGSSLHDWIEKIRFPDAFVVGVNLSPESQKKLEELPYVTATSSVGVQTVETDAFGLRGRMKLKTYFIAFEPRSFYKMNRLDWIQGDPETAARRIEQGGAVIVAREYLTAKGLGVGSVFTCRDAAGNELHFDIVGVVASPGLEIISDLFDVGAEFQDQKMHMVFGGRKDLKEKFGNDAIGLIQMDFADNIDDKTALQGVREALIGSGVLNAGSGREIKEQVAGFVRSAMLVSSVIALFAMFVSCFGVANLIVAGVQSRKFEFGVLRAVGGSSALLTRVVLGEAVIVGLSASLVGTCFGAQGSFGASRLSETLWGIQFSPRPPLWPTLSGCAIVLVMCIAAAYPTALALSRKGPRELLSSMRG